MWALRACELLVALMFATAMPWQRAFGWFGVIASLGVLRWWHVNRPSFRALPKAERKRVYRAYTWVLMTFVGSSCWVLYVPGNIRVQTVLMTYLLGNATLIAVRLTGDVVRTTIALCLAVLPTSIRLFHEGVTTDDALLAMLGVGGVMMTITIALMSRAQESNVRQQYEQRRRAEAAARAVAAMGLTKSRFFAAVSHDLRQPVHAIGLHLDPLIRLADRAQDQQALRSVDGISQSWRALDDLLSQVLDLTRMDTGTVEADLGPTELEPLVVNLVAQHSAAAEQAAVRIVALVKPGRYAMADELMLMRVLSNLLDNAIKFSLPGGSVMVVLRPWRGGWRLQVRDSGMGIAAAAQARVFEEFVQVDNEARDRRRGLGLGLAIARRFMLLMGGDITVRSELGKGCCMSVTLPAAERPETDGLLQGAFLDSAPGESSGARVRVPVLQPNLKIKQVLLVEDDLLVAAATQELLESWGVSVRHVETASRAYEEAGYGEVAICDERLPNKASGLEVALRMRALGKKVLVMSGETNAELRARAQDQSVTLLTKPVSSGKLLAALQAL